MKFLFILLFVCLICSLSNASSSSSSESSSSSSSSESSSSSSSIGSKKLKYSYTIWIGDDVNHKYTINLKSKRGISFIDAIMQAASKNKNFKFEQTIHPTYGVLINELCGVANDKNRGQYWMLYDLTSKPDIKNKPCTQLQSNVGVGELKVVQHHCYLFWYKTNDGECA